MHYITAGVQITGNGAKGPVKLKIGNLKKKNQLKLRIGIFFFSPSSTLYHCSLFKNVKLAAAKRDSTQLRHSQ